MRRQQRGFTMLTTTVLLAIVALASLLVFDLVKEDAMQTAQQRRSMSSRLAAEGGLMELLNDQEVLGALPLFDTANMRSSHQPTTSSLFGRDSIGGGSRQFSADVELVRQVPMLESSHNVVRALVYDVRVEAVAEYGNTAGIQAEVFRIAASQPGIILPRMHAR